MQQSFIKDIEAVNLNNSGEVTEQFIVKRAETSDIYHFIKNESNSSKNFDKFFTNSDLEALFETSLISITVIDNRTSNYAGLFIFNDTPFGVIRKEGYPNTGGIWENWFLTHYDDVRLRGTDSIWLTYYCLNENYINNEEMQKKIFHKVHLSLYTTLPAMNGVFFLMTKNNYQELGNVYSNTNYQIQDFPAVSVKIMVDYMYELLNEIDQNSKNNLVIFLNRRITVFPLFEIRAGTEEDHDDLENIFKDQTPSEVVHCYEDFFIAKMIASQDENNKVLVGQINDKAVGMLAVSTDVNISLLIKSFDLELYDNLLKHDYMKAVKLKRKHISSEKEKILGQEKQDIVIRYKQEIMSCEKISQMIYLQEYIIAHAKFIENVEEIEKTCTEKEILNTEFAQKLIEGFLKDFTIKYPNLEQFEGKIKIDEGKCLLTDEFNFFIETLEFFGLPKGYMQKAGHWTDWLQKEAEKKAQKELFKKKLILENKNKRTQKNPRKENEETPKPMHFDFSPLVNSMRSFKDANLTARSTMRKIILENKHLIASLFVNDEGEPSETKCFDLKSLKKRLAQSKVDFPDDYGDLICPMFLCFGNLPFEKRVVMKLPEEEEEKIQDKKDFKKKAKKVDKKKEVKEEEEKKIEVKPVPVTLYEVALSDFLKSLEISFEYDKLLYELNIIHSDSFKLEYNDYIKMLEEKDKNKFHEEPSSYEKIYSENFARNLKDSEAQLEKYSFLLANFDDENASVPTSSEVLNAFCVKLFFIEQAFESRSTDFLLQAFDCFPDKDYLVIVQSHSYYENSLLEPFIKVSKKFDSLFPDVLYIIHRESLMIPLINVQYSKMEDLVSSSYLFEQLGSSADHYYKLSYDAINNKGSKYSCITSKINENNFGIFLISKEINIDYYDAHFNIRDFSNLDKINKNFHGRILMFAVHKNFQQYTKLIIKEITRLMNKISLYYELYPDVKECPKFVKNLLLIRNRKFPRFIVKNSVYEKELYEDEKIRTRTDGEERDELDETELDFCLVMTTKKMSADTRFANNNRIVVVGASDTGISFIESLLSIRHLDFSYIYLVAPGGLLYHHIEDEILNLKVSSNNYQINDLKKLLLEHRIKIIDSKVIDIKPTQKYIQLEDNSVLNYDYLVLTLGLQDKLWVDLKNTVNKQLVDKFNELKEMQGSSNAKDINNLNNTLLNVQQQMKVVSVDDPYLYTIFSPSQRIMNSLRKNPKFEIVLYGRSLNLMCFIQGLIKRDIKPHKIKWVIPNIYAHAVNKDDKSNFKKDQNLLEEISFTNSTSFENTPELEAFLMKALAQMGVKIYQNYNFSTVNLNETNDAILSYTFQEDGSDRTEEISANIIVTGGLIDVDQIVFKFIHDNRLVYNGRAIIDRNFLTADNSIFAAGRLCEFSQRYQYIEKGKLLRLER